MCVVELDGIKWKERCVRLHAAPCAPHHVAQFPVKLHIPIQHSYTPGIWHVTSSNLSRTPLGEKQWKSCLAFSWSQPSLLLRTPKWGATGKYTREYSGEIVNMRKFVLTSTYFYVRARRKSVKWTNSMLLLITIKYKSATAAQVHLKRVQNWDDKHMTGHWICWNAVAESCPTLSLLFVPTVTSP